MTKASYIHFTLMTALVCLGLAACGKSDDRADDVISFPLEVKATALEEQGPVRLFTKDGEVTDEAIIEGFIAAEAGNFNQTFKPDKSDNVTLLTDSTAQFGFSAVFHRVSAKNDSVFFRAEFQSPLQGETIFYGQDLDWYNILKHKDPLVVIPTNAGNSYKITEVRAAKGNYRSFRLPLLSYKLIRKNDQNPEDTYMLGAGTANELNESFLNSLKNQDTLAYQQSYVRYKG